MPLEKILEKISHGAVSISLQIILVCFFITIFFFVYVYKFERENFKKQMAFAVDNIMNDIKDITPPIKSDSFQDEYIIAMNGIIDMMKIKNIKNGQNILTDISAKNAAIKKRAFIVAGIFSSVFVAIIALIYYKNRKSITEDVRYSLISLFFIGLCEYLFLIFVIGKYITVDPDSIKYTFANSLLNWIQINKN